MFLKVMWNREGFPNFSLYSCDEVIVQQRVDEDGAAYVHVTANEHSVCLKPGGYFAYVLNDNGKTVETIIA